MLARFVGNEEKLIESCVKNYGPEPPPEAFRDRLERYLQNRAPERLHEVPSLMQKFKNIEPELLAKLSIEVGTEPDPPTPRGGSESAHQKRRLIRYYKHYAPEKTEADVDKAVEKYSASNDFSEMWAILEKKYGPESAAANSRAGAPL